MPNEMTRFAAERHEKLWGAETWMSLAGMPLLFKVIDAKTRLSVQVHPNERTRLVTGGDPKTEMWCMLEDGFIYAGLKDGVGPRDIEAAVASGRFEELMVRHDAKAGDVFFIPGGLVHAIGDNVRLYEVQQYSDTTFRLYDWNRVGADGKPRELHVEKSLAAIDYTLRPPVAAKTAKSPFFDFRETEVEGETTIAARDGSFTVLHAAKGSFTVNGAALPEGEGMYVPEGTDMTVAAAGKGLLLVTTL